MALLLIWNRASLQEKLNSIAIVASFKFSFKQKKNIID